MNAFGKYCHDFPRLAKESGYKFQLYRNRVNWDDLDKINIREIIDERNFQLLEENLIHVINCNLEKEYDVNMLDQNFVKLFRLAQLGIDYLSYCELYLDRCVILLQEQLSSCQQECALLKDENEKKTEELKKIKKKSKMQYQNYKCNKCEKIFLNESYLESHEKRRHNSLPDESKIKKHSYIDQSQQTEGENTSVTVFTQTISSGNEVDLKDCPELSKIGEQELKIDYLKRDLEELKIRLSLAEKAMGEKKNEEKNFQSNFPNGVIPVIHSYISTPTNRCAHVDIAPPALLPGLHSQPIYHEETAESYESDKQMDMSQLGDSPAYNYSNKNIIKCEEQSLNKTVTQKQLSERDSGRTCNKNEVEESSETNNQENYSKSFLELGIETHLAKKTVIVEEEVEKDVTAKGKTPYLTMGRIDVDFHDSLGPSPAHSNSNLLIEVESLDQPFELIASTPVQCPPSPKSKYNEINKWDSPENKESVKRDKKIMSQKNLIQEINASDNHEKSLLRKLMTKKSPKIQEITVNLKNSLSQMYGSVSSVAKKNTDVQRGSLLENTRSDIVEGLHSRLKDLGIDPEWSGIPKETMKQKLKILEHHRSLLNKENRLYPYLRKKIEKHVLKRLKRNSLSSKKNQMGSELATPSKLENSDFVHHENVIDAVREITLYDTDGDSEIENSPENKDIKSNSPQKSGLLNAADQILKVASTCTDSGKLKLISSHNKREDEEREATDFSIFQVGRYRELNPRVVELEVSKEKVEKPKNTLEELHTDSDLDELFKEDDHDNINTVNGHIKSKLETHQTDVIGSFPAKVENFSTEFSCLRNLKSENQSILKSEPGQYKSRLLTRKRVLFAEEPEVFDSVSNSTSQASNIIFENHKINDLTAALDDDDDDDWSIESEWTVNSGLRN